MTTRASDATWLAPEFRSAYRRIFIVESRRIWAAVRSEYDPALDLVLTYDFALRREIGAQGGTAHYVDRLVDPEVMRENNLLVYRFMAEWSIDAEGRDLIAQNGVEFGSAFRQDFWNDLLFYARLYLCLERLRTVAAERIYVGTDLGLVEQILKEWGIPVVAVTAPPDVEFPSYAFPIHRWVDESLRRRGIRAYVYPMAFRVFGLARHVLDFVTGRRWRPSVFVQEYFPTVAIAKRLRADRRVRVIAPTPTRAHLFDRSVHVPPVSERHHRRAEVLWQRFLRARAARLVLTTGSEITAGAFRIIDGCVRPRIPAAMSVLEGALRRLQRDPFTLEVLIANIGQVVTVIDCVCRVRGIPSFLIINGFLVAEYGDESKRATTINAYSTSIKAHYFRGIPNVVCLGDPRMDAYPSQPRRTPVAGRFTVTIGAAGFNVTDLNSYVAVEFDFLHDVLEGLRRVKATCPELRVVIKVRSNGYRQQYEQFTAEYFPGLVDEIVDQGTVVPLFPTTDFYISIYSTTLFEASCHGIPVLYYRVGDYFKYPPFDGKSEIVTAETVDEVVEAVEDARAGHPRFDPFLDRAVMERYVGPLDGRNVERNLRFIYEQLGMSPLEEAS